MTITKEDVFDRVYRSLYKTFSKGIVRHYDHPYWKHDFCKSFKDLDKYLTSELGTNWIKEEWAKYWLGNHFLFERTLVRHEVLNARGPIYKKRTLGSRRNLLETQGPRQLMKKVPPEILGAFIKELKEQGVLSKRKQAAAIREKYGINISHETVRYIKKKYNI